MAARQAETRRARLWRDRHRTVWVVVRLAVVLFALVVVLSDWPASQTSDHWVAYPFFASIASGLLLLVVTYIVVDELIDRQNSAKWSSVANSGFRALASIADNVSDGLAELVVGVDDRSTSGVTTNLSPTLRERAEELTAFDGPPNRSRDRPEHRDAFLAALEENLRNARWCDVAQRATHGMRRQLRDNLAVWLAAMLTTAELSRIANRVALLDQRLMSLQGPMLWLSKIQGGTVEADPEGRPAEYYHPIVYSMLQGAFVETAALSESLSRAAKTKPTSYVHRAWRLRNRLDERHLAYLTSIVDEGPPPRLDRPVIGDTLEGDYLDRVIVPPPPPPRHVRAWREVRGGFLRR
jgi:hypothetical protein